jgi:fermentation-respiration switch protein FrsA (DUF1100 family)
MLLLVAVYVFCVCMLAFLQRSLIYFPSRDQRIEPSDAGLPEGQVHTVTVPTADGLQLRGWHILPAGCTAAGPEQCDRQLADGAPVFVYFSGNAGNRMYRTPEFETLAQLGCHILVVDYRGYGDNPGSPSEQQLAADAQAVWEYATRRRGIAAARLILFGESLGGAVAVRLAAERCDAGTPPGGLVLRATFSSLVDVAAYHYPWLPVRLVLVDRYPAVDRIGRVSCPILQIHGLRDQIVPIRLGRELHRAAPATSSGGVPKQMVELPAADHNDILLVAQDAVSRAIDAFLQRAL